MPVAKMEEIEKRFGCPLIELWGMTELAGLGTTFPSNGPHKLRLDRHSASSCRGPHRRFRRAGQNHAARGRRPASKAASAPVTSLRSAHTGAAFAEVRWACRSEEVVHLDDLMLRRTRLGLLLPNGAAELLPRVKTIAQKELGWSDTRWIVEVAAYRDVIARGYAVPGAPS
jgi:glycerol-3-phosphate dehydrogenase